MVGRNRGVVIGRQRGSRDLSLPSSLGKHGAVSEAPSFRIEARKALLYSSAAAFVWLLFSSVNTLFPHLSLRTTTRTSIRIMFTTRDHHSSSTSTSTSAHTYPCTHIPHLEPPSLQLRLSLSPESLMPIPQSQPGPASPDTRAPTSHQINRAPLPNRKDLVEATVTIAQTSWCSLQSAAPMASAVALNGHRGARAIFRYQPYSTKLWEVHY